MKFRQLMLVLTALACANTFAESRFALTLERYKSDEPVLVPSGNFNNAQQAFDNSKYRGAIALISKRENICEIKKASELYKLDPVNIMGSIVGEHTFNVNAVDWGQNAWAYMRSMWTIRFSENGLDLADILREPRYKQCETSTDNNYDLWECYESAWRADRRNGRRGSDRSAIKWAFFNPLGVGYSYGFGQMGPERALRITDLVAKTSGLPLLNVDNPNALYEAVLNPKITIHYIAASNRTSIEVYRRVANFDISQNIGVIATLYNLGKEQSKATDLRQRNLRSAVNGTGLYPEVNYYGWFVNSKEAELRAVYLNAIAKARCP